MGDASAQLARGHGRASQKAVAVASGMDAARPKPLAGSAHDSPSARLGGNAQKSRWMASRPRIPWESADTWERIP